MLGCLYCIISIILESNYKKIIIFSFLFLVNFSLIFWLGGRGSILAFLISAVLSISLIQTRFTIKVKNVIYTLGLIIISCIISIPFSVYQWNGLNRFFRLSQDPDLTLDRFSTGRVDLWIESVNLISKNILIGYGPEAHIFETKIGFLQPHNFVLQFLLEFGLLGCLLFLIILYYIIKKSLDNIRINCNINNLFCFSVIISIAIHGLYDGTLYHAPPIIIFCIGSAYIFSEFLKRNNILTKYQVSNVKTNEK
ncbi:O-antigen ligase family protein [Vibrio natriegens]|uniref:O-antigen ligase family protein n=1 Tax=Vibrio natriegens TaxID=691 RepID=UPI0034DB3C7D